MIKFRYIPIMDDCEKIRHIVQHTGFFNSYEIDIAVELVYERLTKGIDSGYYFVFAEISGKLIGYTCYGHIPCTSSSYDLYWIAVDPDFQKRGIGMTLLKETEKLIYSTGGARIYIETSNRLQYDSTRTFYERCGYKIASLLEDFYAQGDAKATYCKKISG